MSLLQIIKGALCDSCYGVIGIVGQANEHKVTLYHVYERMNSDEMKELPEYSRKKYEIYSDNER